MAIKDDVAHNYGHAQSRKHTNTQRNTHTHTHTHRRIHKYLPSDKTRQGINKNDASIQISLARLRQYIVAFMRILCIMRHSGTFSKAKLTVNYCSAYMVGYLCMYSMLIRLSLLLAIAKRGGQHIQCEHFDLFYDARSSLEFSIYTCVFLCVCVCVYCACICVRACDGGFALRCQGHSFRVSYCYIVLILFDLPSADWRLLLTWLKSLCPFFPLCG